MIDRFGGGIADDDAAGLDNVAGPVETIMTAARVFERIEGIDNLGRYAKSGLIKSFSSLARIASRGFSS